MASLPIHTNSLNLLLQIAIKNLPLFVNVEQNQKINVLQLETLLFAIVVLAFEDRYSRMELELNVCVALDEVIGNVVERF